MGTDEVESVLPGGPSGNVFSGLYTSEMENYLNFKYKKMNLKSNAQSAQKTEL